MMNHRDESLHEVCAICVEPIFGELVSEEGAHVHLKCWTANRNVRRGWRRSFLDGHEHSFGRSAGDRNRALQGVKP